MRFFGHPVKTRKDLSYWGARENLADHLNHAEELAQKTGLWMLDALHLASVLTFQAASGVTIPFITSNVRQQNAATMSAIKLIWVD